ncbi:MAG: hypothetical protein ACKVOR_10820 [Flavobacteriales bacterium]
MIRIFNFKEKRTILIDETSSMVCFHSNDWDEENPHLIIELKGFHFSHHARTCEDCGSFLNAFATESVDWCVEYLGKTKRLDLSRLGKNFNDNQFTYRISDFANGTKMKLNIDLDTLELLDELLKVHEQLEDYDQCCRIRDKMKAISI